MLQLAVYLSCCSVSVTQSFISDSCPSVSISYFFVSERSCAVFKSNFLAFDNSPIVFAMQLLFVILTICIPNCCFCCNLIIYYYYYYQFIHTAQKVLSLYKVHASLTQHTCYNDKITKQRTISTDNHSTIYL